MSEIKNRSANGCKVKEEREVPEILQLHMASILLHLRNNLLGERIKVPPNAFNSILNPNHIELFDDRFAAILKDGVEFLHLPKSWYTPSELYKALSNYNLEDEPRVCTDKTFKRRFKLHARGILKNFAYNKKHGDRLNRLSLKESYRHVISDKGEKGAGHPYHTKKNNVEFEEVLMNIKKLLNGDEQSYYTLYKRIQAEGKHRPV
jgi:hypothetical protein